MPKDPKNDTRTHFCCTFSHVSFSMHFSAVTGDVTRVLFVIVSLPDYLGGYETYGYEVNIEHIPGIFESTTSLLYPKEESSGETASGLGLNIHLLIKIICETRRSCTPVTNTQGKVKYL